MLELSLALCILASVALFQRGSGASPRWGVHGLAMFLTLTAVASSIARFDLLRGTIVVLVAFMVAASLVALLLAPRPHLARNVALPVGLCGVALAGLELWEHWT